MRIRNVLRSRRRESVTRQSKTIHKIRPFLEILEDRLAPAVQAVSLADPSLYAVGGGASSLNQPIREQTISNDGRFVAFVGGDNLAPGDANHMPDIYVRDLVNGTTTLVSMTPSGTSGNGNSINPMI